MKTKTLLIAILIASFFASCVKETTEDVVPNGPWRDENPTEQYDSNLRYLVVVSQPYRRYWNWNVNGTSGWYNCESSSFSTHYKYESKSLTYVGLNDYAKEVIVPYRMDSTDTFVGIDTAFWLRIRLPGATDYTNYEIW